MKSGERNSKNWAESIAAATSITAIVVLLAAAVAAQELPLGLQKINEYNQLWAQDIALKVSFFVAFVAGILGILSPCILPFLPAYFSYTFKEKRNITFMTLVFFLGFSLSFVTMGVVAGFLGSTALAVVQPAWLVRIAGAAIIGFGIMTLMGKGISSFLKFRTQRNDTLGIFLLGIFFAIGWSACLGPILAGILGIGAVLANPVLSGVLLFFYALGNLVPLFILSVFYDKLNLSKSRLIQGKILSFSLLGETYKVHSTNLISGVLFLALGGVMLFYSGTSVVNTWDILGTKELFFSFQNSLVKWEWNWLVGTIGLIAFGILVMFVMRKKE